MAREREGIRELTYEETTAVAGGQVPQSLLNEALAHLASIPEAERMLPTTLPPGDVVVIGAAEQTAAKDITMA
jgi:hypothetical protein